MLESSSQRRVCPCQCPYKRRYSKGGCARCRDPAFRERQLARSQGKDGFHEPKRNGKAGKKRQAEALTSSTAHDLPTGSKRTRFTRKARQAGRASGVLQAGKTEKQHAHPHGQSSQEDHVAARDSSAAPGNVTETQNSTGQAETQGALDSHDANVQQSGRHGTESQKAEAEDSEHADKQAASGLELGLMAGLLPLQQEASAGNLAAKPIELLGAPLSASNAMPGTSIGKEKDVHKEQKQPAQSTSQQSREVSHTSTGGESWDTAQRAQRIEDSRERQRLFMEQLQRKVQHRKESADVNSKPCLAALLASAAKKKRKDKQPFAGNPRVSLWEPPQSPYGLIEEQLFGNPWKLLVACILLNKTSVVQVRKIIWKLFELMPTPEAGMHADEEAVRELIQPLGLAPKRAPMLIRFCRDYVEKQWTDPKELHGVGQYAADAYNIFCRGDWRSVSPTDKDLLKYHRWLVETNGEGIGLLRETEPQSEPECRAGVKGANSEGLTTKPPKDSTGVQAPEQSKGEGIGLLREAEPQSEPESDDDVRVASCYDSP